MDRVIVHPSQLPAAEDFLDVQVNSLRESGRLIYAMTGGMPVVDGVACSPTLPASMAVSMSAGTAFWPTVVDGGAFGVLSPDLRACMKAGSYDGQTIPVSAPTAPGTDVVFLVQATFAESDTDPLVLDYYNATNPSQPYSGPSNSGAAEYTRRADRCAVALKAGSPAATGQATAPGADPGWVPLWLILVHAGAVAIGAGDISPAPAAPRFTARLTSSPTDLSGYATNAALAAEVQARTTAEAGTNAYLTDENSGRTQADTVLGQRLDALRLGFRSMSVLTASTAFAVPSGITVLKVTAVGGGGGAGSSSSTTAGGGGGAGGTAVVYVGVTPGQSIPVTVGTYGANSTGGADGGNGTSSSFGSYASGSGGAGGSGGNNGGAGGAPGNGFGSGLNLLGGFGTDSSGGLSAGGIGGASSMGGGGRASQGAISVENGQAFGSGGGGGYGNANNAGGAGQQGVVVIEY